MASRSLNQDGGERTGLLTRKRSRLRCDRGQDAEATGCLPRFSKILIPVLLSQKRQSQCSCGFARPETISSRAQRSDSITSCLGVAKRPSFARRFFGLENWTNGGTLGPKFKCSPSVSIEFHSTDVLPSQREKQPTPAGSYELQIRERSLTPMRESAFFRFGDRSGNKFRAATSFPHGR